jgi:hypothetical protein
VNTTGDGFVASFGRIERGARFEHSQGPRGRFRYRVRRSRRTCAEGGAGDVAALLSFRLTRWRPAGLW